MALNQVKIEYVRDSFTREDRLAIIYLEHNLPVSLKNANWLVDTEKKKIVIGKNIYYYQVRIINDLAYLHLTECISNKNNIYQMNIINKRMSLKKRPVKTLKGKSSIRVKKLIYGLALISLLGVSASKYQNSNLKVYNETELLTESEELSIPKMTITTEPTIVANEEVPPSEEIMPILASLPNDFKLTDERGYQKRYETEELYGNDILENAERRGLDYTLAVCHLTFERSNNPLDSAEKQKNIGQLTTSLCGELITAPVYQDGVITHYDKYYLLPPDFHRDYDELKEQGELLKSQDEEIQLVQWNSIYEEQENILLSLAYLSYIIDQKKHDLVRGMMSYNAGYGSVKDSYTYEDIFNGCVTVDDPYYWKHMLQYLEPNEIAKGFDVYINNQKYHYEFIEKELLENNEKENGYHL